MSKALDEWREHFEGETVAASFDGEKRDGFLNMDNFNK
jgi:hypothetical protein